MAKGKSYVHVYKYIMWFVVIPNIVITMQHSDGTEGIAHTVVHNHLPLGSWFLFRVIVSRKDQFLELVKQVSCSPFDALHVRLC